MAKFKLSTMFLTLLVVLFFAAIVFNYFWTSASQQQQMEKELIEKGMVLSQQMDAVWTFMSYNQDELEKIAYTEEGVYRGLHCAIVGRSIGIIFSQDSNYTTRFVNFSPRNPEATPDEFETEALNTFLNDPDAQYYSAFEEVEGERVFRYSAPMNIQDSCLECHGTPAGEIDATGFPKEGWSIGDVGGAISIIIPLDVYEENMQATVANNLTFFIALLLLFSILILLALTYLVTGPLKKIKQSVQNTSVGELDIELAPTETSKEISEFVDELNDMSTKLAELYDSLETQVADRTAQLSEANELLVEQREQLEHINSYLADESQYKSDFLAMMSHELRTPLTSIVAFTNLLKKTAAQNKDEDLEEISSEIESSSQILLTIINDILDMSRIEAGKAELNLGPVDFGDLVAALRDFMQPIAEKKDISLRYEIDKDVPLTFADFDKLHHIAINLLSNAIKFTPDGGSVLFHISYEPPKQTSQSSKEASALGHVVLQVIDTGIGIDAKDQRGIFERFRQVDSSVARGYSGTGLGLALVKEYALMHGGRVAVKSTVGEGSTFSVYIPARQEKKL